MSIGNATFCTGCGRFVWAPSGGVWPRVRTTDEGPACPGCAADVGMAGNVRLYEAASAYKLVRPTREGTMMLKLEEIESTLALESDEALQAIVNSADMALHLESARAYGLVTGGPAVDTERCELVVKAAARRGLVPAWAEEELRLFLAACRHPSRETT